MVLIVYNRYGGGGNMHSGFVGAAWLLSQNGAEIMVEGHPIPQYQFEQIVELIVKHGSDSQSKLALEYQLNPSDELHDKLLAIYQDGWCKVRAWGTFYDEVTFRITSTSFNWYDVIVKFLLNHPMFKNSLITVESDKSSGVRKTFWHKISYFDAISDEYSSVLASVLCRR
jgi:hypothetical protein